MGIRTTSDRRRPRGGVVPLGLLVGTAALALVVTLALPTMAGTGHRLDDEGDSLVKLLHSARRIAVLRAHPMVVAFDTERAVLRIHHDLDGDGRAGAGEDVRLFPLREHVGFGRGGAPPLPDGGGQVTFSGRSAGLPAFSFDPHGRASESGTAYLTSRAPGRRPEDTRALSVDGATGAVTCLAFGAEGWEPGC